MKILVLAFTSKVYKSEPLYTGTPGVYTDRADLTRKLSCMDTWVPRVEDLGHEVIFFDGGNESVSYDEKNKLLHLTSSDSYDYHYLANEKKPSFMLMRLQEAVAWALTHKDFDYVLRIDDGSYVNAYTLPEITNEINKYDIVWSGYGGGGGIFFSRKACEELIKIENTEHHLEDMAIFNSSLFSGDFTKRTSNRMSSTYFVGEQFATIHYTTGKRMYLVDYIMSSYYNSMPLERKVIVNYPILSTTPLKTNTIDCTNSNTPLWYGLDRDKYNWEYYGAYTRSSPMVIPNSSEQIPFATHSVKNLFLYNMIYDVTPQLEQCIMKYFKSIQIGGTMNIFYSEKHNNLTNRICDILSANGVGYRKENNTLISDLIKTEYVSGNESGVVITIKK
jgi:hypothetical protein